DGMREAGASVPPELLPEVSAAVRVVCVDADDGLVEAPGELARGLNVVPSALPRLQATADGGLVVGYRVHRQLPLMTYYWEAAAQVLGPDGWRPPITFGGTDATLEEGSLAAAGPRVLLVSRCTSGDEPSLEDFYRYAWDVNEYDFWAVTDHAENSTAYQWWSIQKIADLLHVPGRFVPLYGFEWTSAEHGHQNVIYGDVA